MFSCSHGAKYYSCCIFRNVRSTGARGFGYTSVTFGKLYLRVGRYICLCPHVCHSDNLTNYSISNGIVLLFYQSLFTPQVATK